MELLESCSICLIYQEKQIRQTLMCCDSCAIIRQRCRYVKHKKDPHGKDPSLPERRLRSSLHR